MPAKHDTYLVPLKKPFKGAATGANYFQFPPKPVSVTGRVMQHKHADDIGIFVDALRRDGELIVKASAGPEAISGYWFYSRISINHDKLKESAGSGRH